MRRLRLGLPWGAALETFERVLRGRSRRPDPIREVWEEWKGKRAQGTDEQKGLGLFLGIPDWLGAYSRNLLETEETCWIRHSR